jgi:MATE family multidrug resistance protein
MTKGAADLGPDETPRDLSHSAPNDPSAVAAPADANPAGRLGALRDSARQIATLAWPVLIGQISVLAFGTVDTLLLARHAAEDLAALAVGSAAYITVFIGFMGVVVAIGPVAGQLFGAGQHAQAGRQAHQAVWVALGMSVLGSALLLFPGPFIALSRASPEVEAKVRDYLMVLALSLPASLLFTVFRGFNTAVSRPKAVMVLQLLGLAVKVPLSTALAWGVPRLGVPALGLLGCGIATAVAMWAQLFLAWQVVRRDAFYRPFELTGRGLDPPDWRALRTHLRLGIPMGASILVEVSGFSFMALFVSQIGTTAVAGHQIAVNVVTLMFMVPLAIGNASTTLVAQAVGGRDAARARRLAWHGLLLGCTLSGLLGVAASLGRGSIVGWYTDNPLVAAAALPLMAWVALFHLADAAQTIAAFVLRAWRIATVPLVIFAAALWGVGLGGGNALAFNLPGVVPASMQGARGFWIASTAGLVLAAVSLIAYLAWVLRRQARPVAAGVTPSAG